MWLSVLYGVYESSCQDEFEEECERKEERKKKYESDGEKGSQRWLARILSQRDWIRWKQGF